MPLRPHLLLAALAAALGGCAVHGTATAPLTPAPAVAPSTSPLDAGAQPGSGGAGDDARGCAVEAGDTSFVLVSTMVARPRAVVLDTLRQILHREGYTIAAEDAGDGRLITAPRFGWPAGTESESWHGSESPGVVVVAAASASGGDSTGVTIATRAVCEVAAPGEQAPSAKVGNALRMVSAMRLASDLSGSFSIR